MEIPPLVSTQTTASSYLQTYLTLLCKLQSMRKTATSSFHPNSNGGVKRVNHTITQILAMVVNEQQSSMDAHLPHVGFVCNISVSAATGLAPNKVYTKRLPRLPLTVFEHPYARRQASFETSPNMSTWSPTAGGARSP